MCSLHELLLSAVDVAWYDIANIAPVVPPVPIFIYVYISVIYFGNFLFQRVDF